MNDINVRLKKTGYSPIGNLLDVLRNMNRMCTTINWLCLMHKRILMRP
jgi:hypothetical protein